MDRDRRYSTHDGLGNYPENPPWTMFFDGPLYQKYDEFMKGKDFTKVRFYKGIVSQR